MKKIFLTCVVALGAMLSSCDMNVSPAGVINENEAVETYNDCERFRAGFYINFRSTTLGSSLIYPELQADYFQALAPLYGNQAGNIFKGDFISSTPEFSGAWAGPYSTIGTINFFLPRCQELLAKNVLTPEKKAAAERVMGEARFFRAFYYYRLFDMFCQAYSEDKKDLPGLGLPLVSKYYPTGNRDQYPGRSTMAETFKFIYNDLDSAEVAIAKWEENDKSNLKPGANYLNTMVIKAFRARLALLQGHKADAVKYAQEVIDCGLYELAPATDYAAIWLNDDPVKEVLFMPFANQNEAASLTKYGALYWLSTNRKSALYIPSAATIQMYKSTDVRRGTFFNEETLQIAGEDVPVTCFYKYPGVDTYTGDAKGFNASKPFRISEMYLIVAECGDETAANDALNAIRKARWANRKAYKPTTYTGDELVSEVRLERKKELIGEGFRISDLRRWNEGFQRDAETPASIFGNEQFGQVYFVAGAANLSYQPGDHRFVWPIPLSEIQVNPQIKGQQNPGY